MTQGKGQEQGRQGLALEFPEFHGKVRFDAATKRGSVLDVIGVVTGYNSSSSSTALRRLSENFGELTERFQSIRINGKGKTTPTGSSKDLIELMMLFPGAEANRARKRLVKYLFLSESLFLASENVVFSPDVYSAMRSEKVKAIEECITVGRSKSEHDDVCDHLAKREGGERENKRKFGSQNAFVDVETESEAIEVKPSSNWYGGKFLGRNSARVKITTPFFEKQGGEANPKLMFEKFAFEGSTSRSDTDATMTQGEGQGRQGLALDFPEFHGKVRFDAATKRGSVLDVIGVVTRLDSTNRTNALNRLEKVQPGLVGRFLRLKINGKVRSAPQEGKETPTGAFRDLIELVMVLPGARANSFRRTAANYLARLMGGDLSLVGEILSTNASVPQEVRDVMLQGMAKPGRPFEEQLERKRRFYEIEEMDARASILQSEAEEKKTKVVREKVQCIQMFGDLSDCDKIYYKSFVRRTLFGNVSGPITPGQIEDTEEENGGRGKETNIHIVAEEIGYDVSKCSSWVGRVLARMWRERHPGEQIPKRLVPFNGRVIKENGYFDCDRDLIERAIRQVAKEEKSRAK
ncbi:EsV-1-210/211 paralog [Durusdinium trenchii]|uniref:EsV-1-210/211 paralog n=1 Tax=Durusdinium trenchii TaxID=1381693 RepID=A0ABP0I3W4_9DINO